jgi:DNA (cytosine-5)-methyltransferase 1
MKQHSEHLFPYKWNLKDGYPAKGIEPNGCKVFGTFICGGGSSMGYKLAGFEHLGGVEIDPKVADIYKANHKPKHLYNEDIRLFNDRNDLPKELYNLDILDGSPPCSTFSMAGSREKAWGKEKQFREGQAMQTLDDLVFVYCDTIIKLQPKVFILENVKGIIQGNAKVYSKNIVKKMQKAGYEVQVFCLNAASMGVPQKRERVFFIGHKKELKFSKLALGFNEDSIPFKYVDEGRVKRKDIREGIKDYYKITPMGKCVSTVHPKGMYFGTYKQHPELVSNTCIADSGGGLMLHHIEDGYLTDNEYKQIGTYPLDYNFKTIEPKYLIGMSVPPVMTAQIANQIWIQWLSKAGLKQGEIL